MIRWLYWPAEETPEPDINTKVLLHFDSYADSQFVDAIGGPAWSGNANRSRTVKALGSSSVYFGQTGYVGISPPQYHGYTQDYIDTWEPGTAPFTLECFVNVSSLSAGHNQLIWYRAGVGDSWYIDTSGNMVFKHDSNTYSFITSSPLDITLNEWHHIAVCRSGASLKMFCDGAEIAVTETIPITAETNFNSGWRYTVQLAIGGYYTNSALTGYMDEFRWSMGVARYSGAYTVPTTQFAPAAEAVDYDYVVSGYSDGDANGNYALESSNQTEPDEYGEYRVTATYRHTVNNDFTIYSDFLYFEGAPAFGTSQLKQGVTVLAQQDNTMTGDYYDPNTWETVCSVASA
jgi:hypothetical protein